MKDVTFVTGNQNKADYLAQLLGHPVNHVGIDLEEIQSLDLQKIVKHKLHQAFAEIGKPVLVEDASLEFKALGRLPGTLIKWFEEELTHQELCTLLDGKDRSAVARSAFGYFDGNSETYFEGSMEGIIAEKPAGVSGFGWDPIFIPKGYSVTRGELSPEDYKKTYLLIKPLEEIKDFLIS